MRNPLPLRRCAALLAILPVLLSACTAADAPTEPVDPTDEDLAASQPPAATSQWLPCAREYSGCRFEGLREVRFILGTTITTMTAYDGLDDCKAEQFGLTVGGSGAARCEYSSAMLTRTLANPMPNMAGMGASVVVPRGHPGFSSARIQATTDFGAPSDMGAFRIPCSLSHFNFDDPIVHPGRPGATHLHMFFGNTATNAHSTASSIAQSGRSTCAGGTANRSAYWVPALIDGKGNAVVPSSTIFYYKTGHGGVAPRDVRQPPAGLRMIAGSMRATTAQDGLRWSCWEAYAGHHATIRGVVTHPACRPGLSLNMGIDFPQCWDGRNLDSPDHQSHMAYATGRGCPTTHPVAIPVISFNIQWKIPVTGAADWHLSSDMYDYAARGGGLSIHGDWFNGWDPAVAATWIQHCNNAAKDCHGYLLGDGRTLF